MKEEEGLINYLTNIILRPHREIYSIQKLGPTKIVVKSHEKSISLLESMSKNEKHLPKQMQQNYCELIQVNRREVTIRSQGKCLQASVYEPQLTNPEKKLTDNQSGSQSPNNKHSNPFPPNPPTNIPHQFYQNCVVFLHANSGSRLQGMQYAKHILQYRTLCVSFDYAGSGISDGQYTTMGVNQAKDLSAVMNFIRDKYRVRRFSLWGRSMGAVTGVYYLLTRYKQDAKRLRVTSCIMDSPFSNLELLIKEIASGRSNLPQFFFQPVLKVIQNQIISKVGVNIFAQLNLTEKIKSLSQEQNKLLESVSFLGLASPEDKMISSEHCEQLCELLIPRDVRNSDLIDEKNFLCSNSHDKHLMMLVEFKKDINMKGDFIQIEGDHNRPRSNEIKEKISFFIIDNFYSYKDVLPSPEEPVADEQRQLPKQINFSKTGLSIKTKLAFTKANQANKSRKDSQTITTPIETLKPQQSISRQNYNLINLKEIKARQEPRKSLSKQKGSIRNSLNKNFLNRQKKDQDSIKGDFVKENLQKPYQNVQNPTAKDSKRSFYQNTENSTTTKGLNIVSKELQRDKSSKGAEDFLKLPKRNNPLENSTMNKSQQKPSNPTGYSSFTSFLNKPKPIESTPKYKGPSSKPLQPQIISQNSGSVNNSLSKQKSPQVSDIHKQPVVCPLDLSQIVSIPTNTQNMTQRLPQKHFESLPSQRFNRNVQSQQYVVTNKLQQSPVSTTPFNLSVDGKFNYDVQNSFQDESFRKKDTSQMLDATDLSIRKQTPKVTQVKFSISYFRNKQEQSQQSRNPISSKPFHVNRKPSIPQGTNGMQNFQKADSIYSQGQGSARNSLNSTSFNKRPNETTSIRNSDANMEQMNQDAYPYIYQPLEKRSTINSINQAQNPATKPSQNVSSSFSGTTENVSLKQMMINSGHKGMTQSSTFNSQNSMGNNFIVGMNGGYNGFVHMANSPVSNSGNYLNQNYAYQQQAYVNPGYIAYGNQSPNYPSPNIPGYMQSPYPKPMSSTVHYGNQNFPPQSYPMQANYLQVPSMTKSMRTSQDVYPQPGTNNNFYQSKPQKPVTYQTNSQQVWYTPQQVVKQPLQYKKKITKLLD